MRCTPRDLSKKEEKNQGHFCCCLKLFTAHAREFNSPTYIQLNLSRPWGDSNIITPLPILVLFSIVGCVSEFWTAPGAEVDHCGKYEHSKFHELPWYSRLSPLHHDVKNNLDWYTHYGRTLSLEGYANSWSVQFPSRKASCGNEQLLQTMFCPRCDSFYLYLSRPALHFNFAIMDRGEHCLDSTERRKACGASL